MCRLTDERLPELSGLVVAGDRMLAMNDGGDRLTVYALDIGCRVVAARSTAVDPYDPEDLAVGADGTVWFADTGDNRTDRPTVALLAMRPALFGLQQVRQAKAAQDGEGAGLESIAAGDAVAAASGCAEHGEHEKVPPWSTLAARSAGTQLAATAC